MVSGQTLRRIRNEYKEYLSEKYANWSANTINTHTSDAFYVWNNTVVESLWKCLESERSMQETYNEILDYLKYEVMSDRAEERAKLYYTDLKRLKNFIDEKYGGIINCIGNEYQAEEILYHCAQDAYEKKISTEEALRYMSECVPNLNETSHRIVLMLFDAMMNGKKYTRRGNIEITMCFIRRIGFEYGPNYLINALNATQQNIVYFYEQTGNKSSALRRFCQKVSLENNAGVIFDERIFEGIIPKKTTDSALIDDSEVRIWLYAAGNQSINWGRDYNDRVMAIGWDELSDLSMYDSKEQIRERMKNIYGENSSYKNDVHAVWQFANDIKIGDIIFVKKGVSKIIGKGVVVSDYEYHPERNDFCNIHRVEWTDNYEFDYAGTLPQKTLTDITGYRSTVETLLSAYNNNELPEQPKNETFDTYTKEDFLEDVFLDESQYEMLSKLLLIKKNIILQGAPGVGKTYAAKRLAFSIMGEKDTSRVKMVQFHQSYSYEDFIMGFRPDQNGFKLTTGVFYKFCKQAEEDDRPYFFIIDEINRGNLSKIFGELFMLIENDKRGVELQLLYSNEQFSIPSNVHIIGMMNTADRSLAMLDYALRRRFAFYDFEPAFESSGFKAYLKKAANEKFERLINSVERLNEEISKDESLGDGFRIGHSYFCTKTVINDEWLSAVVEFELIPLLKEYWFDEPSKIKDWSNNLRSAIR